VAAGHRVRPRAYNAALEDALPCRLRARSDQPAALQPPNAALIGSGPSGLANVQARRRMLLECDGRAELSFEDGSPALAIADSGRGRTAILAVPLDADWSDLPLRPGFLPLLVGLIKDVSQTGELTSGPVTPGTAVKIPVPPGATALEVVTPDGLRRRYDALEGSASVDFGETDRAGPYRVLSAGPSGALRDAPRGAFVVQAPIADSDLRTLGELDTLSADAADGGGGAEVQRSLSPLIFLLFALLVLAEGGVRLRTA
jgi:hypothetical protein